MSSLSTEKVESESSSEQKKRRNQPGRSSRRRRAKVRAIHEAESKLLFPDHSFIGSTHATGVTAPSSVVDSSGDRDQIWPGVQKCRCKLWLNIDEVALVGQLGYLPGNAVAVVARSSKTPQLGIQGNVPIVLQLYPIAIRNTYAGGKSDGRKFKSRKRSPWKPPEGDFDEDNLDRDVLIEPFPTMYWLTHPLLRMLTSKLEVGDTHNVRQLEKRLSTDDVALQRMRAAHLAYGKARWELLTPEDQAEMERRKWKESLAETTGVAGIRKSIAIKCLHSHLAHHLSGGPGSHDNVVGEWVLQELCRIVRLRNESNVSSDS